jgi:predicted nucleic acid-binding protein
MSGIEEPSDRAEIDLIAIDTGVWLEGLLFGGAAEELVRMAVAEQIRLVTSESLVLELCGVLENRLGFSSRAAEAVGDFVRECAEVKADLAPASGPGLSRHARILRMAEACDANAILTTERSGLHRLAGESSVPVVAID